MPIQRLIPILLLDDSGQLVKTRRFKNRKYIGDPLVALRLFNDLGADELIVLLVGDGSYQQSEPPWKLLENLAGEALMPLSYGGSLVSPQDALRVIALGFEKVIYSASRLYDGTNLAGVVDALGSQSISICVNYVESLFSGRVVRCHKANKKLGSLLDITEKAARIGVGEILLQSITREGERNGLDLEAVKEVTDKFKGPVVVSGGLSDLSELDNDLSKNISGFAAGSFFVFSGTRRGVLISYPDDLERNI